MPHDQENKPTIASPATGEPIATENRESPERVQEAVARAREVQPGWAAEPVRARSRVLRRMGQFLVENADQAARTVSACTGKPLMDALSTEVVPGAIAARYYARMAPRFLRPERRPRSSPIFFTKSTRIVREPYGVVGIITPWNYPLGIPLHELLTALVCGNAVVLKVATQAQPVGALIRDMVRASGLEPTLLQVVDVPGSAAGRAFVESGIDKLFFTGSTAIGAELMQQAGEHLLPVSLELGGNDPMIVLDDADPYRAALGALWAGASNAGQSCGAVERIYVHRSLYEPFREHLAAMVRAVRAGAPDDRENELGFMTTSGQLETVRRQLRDAFDRGCHVVATAGDEPVEAGSKDGSQARRRGLHHPVVLVEEVDPSSSLVSEETFGPVLVIAPFDHEEEALARANDSEYGLTASIWTRNRRRGRRLAHRIHAGAVTINDHLMSHGMPETPWGGFKKSGVGRSHGKEGFLEMTQPKAIVDDRFHRAPAQMWWPPYSQLSYRGIRAAADLFLGASFRRRAAAIPTVLALFARSLRRRYTARRSSS